MPQPLDAYTASAADWRGSIKKNNTKTFLVIAIFFAIYVALGLLVDTFIVAGENQQSSIPDIFHALITFQIFPLVTNIMFFVAAFSIFITFAFADKLMLLGTEYKEVSTTTTNSSTEQQLYNVVEEMKIAAGLRFMPRVYVIDADYMNAFASGWSEKSAMVAITRGLMEKLNRSELSAVMAHELSHIRHMDIKLTLMASVLANLILMVLDMFFYNALFSQRRDNDSRRSSLFMIIMVARYLLPVVNILLLLYLSRTREYMADAGSVELMRDNQPLASALLKIQDDHVANEASYSAAYRNTPHENVRREAYIFDPVQAGIESMTSLADAFSTHPNIKARLAAIGYKENTL